MDITMFLAAILAASPPMIFAVMGETITEKAGVINLSIDGSLLLSAMVGFAVSLKTNSVLAGFVAGMMVGAMIALIIAVTNITLKQPQVATGFVLTLLCRDLAYVLGNPYAHIPGPQVVHQPIPYLVTLPIIGPILFNQNLIVYLSLLVILVTWTYIHKTQPGLKLQGLGEQPAAVYVRGVNVTRMRHLYTAIGGALVGLGGASFSLLIKPGWARPYGIEGVGWIVLAIVIFGGWRVLRAAVGVYLFVLLQMLANTLQSIMPNVPTQVFPTIPFPLMILTLVLVTLGNADWVNRLLEKLPPRSQHLMTKVIQAMQTSPPAALGKPWQK